MKKISSGMKQNDFNRILGITAFGGLIYYLECKFSALERRHNERFQSMIIIEEKYKATDGNVKIFTEQIIRSEIRNDMREIELRKTIENVRAEIRAEKRWF